MPRTQIPQDPTSGARPATERRKETLGGPRTQWEVYMLCSLHDMHPSWGQSTSGEGDVGFRHTCVTHKLVHVSEHA